MKLDSSVTAIITGGSSGLGAATARRFAAQGVRVAIFDFNETLGEAIAAEIGTMKVTEQIDALTTLATNPIKYLVAPRIVAAVVSMPILTLIGDSIGVMGGYLVSVHSLGFSPGPYISNTLKFLETIDVVSGLVKAAFFGFVISIMGCYFGYNSKGGAEGVGIATTNAVVAASIVILLLNYIITGVFFG
jgi:phospholipid/cholesterol/gamma-HCH transport system permease protein